MRSTSSTTKRFMAPSGGPVSVSAPSPLPSSSNNASSSSSNNFMPMSANTRVPLVNGRQQLQSQQPAVPSRYLVTVIPPEQLPHDPPHPRTSTFCSGYGPPSKFRRGTLVPLHSTLAGQAAAIAREYGLPSTGGIVLYLVELTQDHQNPLGDALVGGPRIGDEAWQLLWGQLFNPPSTAQDDYEASLSEEDEAYFDQYPAQEAHSTSIPAMPPLPPSMRSNHPAYGPQESSAVHHQHQTSDVRPQSPSEHHSDVSSLADNSSALASEDLLGHQSMVSSNTSHVFSPASTSMRQTKSSHSHDAANSIPSSPHMRPYSSASRGKSRNHARGQARRPSTSNLRSNTSRHSVRSNRSYSHSNTSAEGPLYGEAVVVGKIEFDIDNRRGAGKWFDAWIQSANSQSPGEATPMDLAQRHSRQIISRHQPTNSMTSGSLLRSRNLVSELELPTLSRSSSTQASLSNASPPSVADLEEASEINVQDDKDGAERPVSQASQASMLQAPSSIRSSIAQSEDLSRSMRGPYESTPQQASPETVRSEHPIAVKRESISSTEGATLLDDSRRTSQASQFSQLSASPAPRSEHSSQDLADWQTDATRSNERLQRLSGERSSSSSFGNEANLEAMNATPRVRAPPQFTTASSSRSPSPSPSQSESPTRAGTRHSRGFSELSATSSSKNSVDDEALARSIQEEQLPSSASAHPVFSSEVAESRSQSAMSQQESASRPQSAMSREEIATRPPSAMSQDEGASRPQSAVSQGERAMSQQENAHRQSIASQATVSDYSAAEPTQEAMDDMRQSNNSSRASSHSRQSSSSFDAVSVGQQDGYQALGDEDAALDPQETHESDQPIILTTSSSPANEEESRYEPSESNDATSDLGNDNTDIELEKGDPLKDVFPSDANTWAQIKYSYDGQDDSATDSPAEEVVQTSLGLGILTSSMLKGHVIPPSASSSLDPFEYDDEAGSTLNSPIGPPADDVKEVSDLLKASAPPAHFGLSSPINLDEPAKRLSRQSQDLSVGDSDREEEKKEVVPVKRGKGHSRKPSKASMASSMRLSAQISLSDVDAAMIPLPESISNRTLASLATSASERSLASMASQPSIWEPETTLTEAPKMSNRDARLPSDWAHQLSAMGPIRSRGNSVTTEEDGSHAAPVMPVGELPPFLDKTGDAPQSRASLASLYAQSARSRSSSVEMMDNLDEIERALAELSPRALKPALHPDANAPNLTSFLLKKKTVETIPGYSKDSVHEEVAPASPTATQAEAATTSRQSPGSDRNSFDSEDSSEQNATYRGQTDPHASPSPPLSAKSTASTLGYMAPPLPLKIRTDRSMMSSPGPASSNSSNPTPLAVPADLPQVETPISSTMQEESITSPGGESQASTTIAYDLPSHPNSPRQHVTFASETQEHPVTPLAKSTGMSGKFAAGLKLKGWSGKASQKENSTTPTQSKEAISPGHSKEPAKSPLPGLKGFKWWQKEGPTQTDESSQKLATEISLPASPITSHQAEVPSSILQKPNPPFSQTARIPRKSSLASLAATARAQDSLSPNAHNDYSMPLHAPVASGMASPQYLGTFPSPPTHTSLPSPPRRPLPLPSFMPSYPPQFVVAHEASGQPTPSLIRNDSSTTQNTSIGASPQLSSRSLMTSSPMVASASLPMLSNSMSQTNGAGYAPHLQRTPEMGSNSHGTFLGQQGRNDGHTTSAPVTPVYASQASLVSSSGRFGKPAKANPAKNNFRLSADADLSRMMNHMQAIEFGEDPAHSSSQPAAVEQGHMHPARNAPPTRGNFGLGLGLPGARKNVR